MKDKSTLEIFIATWFNTGFIPPILLKGMAGTYGSILALPLCWLCIASIKHAAYPISILLYGIPCMVILTMGLLSISQAERDLGPQMDWKGKTKTRDQNQIVIDEVFGMLISCIPLLFVPEIFWWHYAVAFLLFRFFDIVKVWPTKIFDRMHNAFGVMMDDFVAGVYSALLLQALIAWVF